MMGDWEGLITFDSPVGPFSVPVSCVRPRFLPSLSTPKLFFNNVIGGTGGSINLKIKNSGAIPGIITGFKVSNPMTNSVANYVLRHQSRQHTGVSEDEGEESGMERETPALNDPPQSMTHMELAHDRELYGLQPNTVQSDVTDFLDDIIENVTESIFAVYVKEQRRDLRPHDQLTLKVHFHPPMEDHYKNALEVIFEDPDIEPVSI
jgi:hypothetical protein